MNSIRLGINFRVFFDIIKAMIKIAFFDIDGTLYDNAHQEWKKKSLEAIKKLQSKGIKCVLCTSRPYHSMERLGTFEQGIVFDGWIGSCGSVTCLDGKIIASTAMDTDLVRRFAKQCGEDGYTMEVVGVFKRTMLFPQTKESLGFYEYFKESLPEFADYDGSQAVKLNFFAPSEAGEKYKKLFPELTIIEYLPNCFDVMEYVHQKCEGCQIVLNALGFTKDEAIAFGDDTQDIAMLESASTFVCMGQGKENVKEVASFVTKPVSEDGVYYGLKHYGLIGEDDE